MILLIGAGFDISAGADVRAKKHLIKKNLQSELEMYKQNMMAQGIFVPT